MNYKEKETGKKVKAIVWNGELSAIKAFDNGRSRTILMGEQLLLTTDVDIHKVRMGDYLVLDEEDKLSLVENWFFQDKFEVDLKEA